MAPKCGSSPPRSLPNGDARRPSEFDRPLTKSTPYRIVAVVGTRPNFMKVGPLVRAFDAHAEVDLRLVHTGQHYDASMSQVFFVDLGLPKPHLNLGVSAATPTRQTAEILTAFGTFLDDWMPDLVIVVGDVTSTLACALASAQSGIPVAHVESGLRSFDRDMPEERNRVLTDHLSTLLYTTEESGNLNLQREGIPEDRVRFVGNVMIDSLLAVVERAKSERPWEAWDVSAGEFILATLHRPSNVDDAARLRDLLQTLFEASSEAPVLFPVHPRTRARISALGPGPWTHSDRFTLCDPVGYVDFVGLMSAAGLVVTDSGGIQEETTVLGIPCLTVRPSTERPVTIDLGTNRLVTPGEDLGLAIRTALDRDAQKESSTPPLWDGRSAQRVAGDVVQFLKAGAGVT